MSAVDLSVAEMYEEHMVPGMFLHWAQMLIELAQLRPGQHVMDLACGTGVGARLAAQAVGKQGRVVGTDIDPGVVALAERLAQAHSPVIEWRCCSALELPYSDGAFDVCLCLQGLQFFPDRAKALSEIHRILDGSGKLVASIWGPLERNAGHHEVVRALERAGVDASAAKRACSFADSGAVLRAAQAAGFREIELTLVDGVSRFTSMESFLEGMTKGSPSTRHAVALLSQAARAQFTAEVRAALEPYVLADATLAYPMQTQILIAHA